MKRASALLWLRPVSYHLVFGAFIVCLAFINGYPLVYSDTGTYLFNAARLEQLDDRPIGYGLIIRALGMRSTLWPVVLFQGVITSWVLMMLVREFVERVDRRWWVHALQVLLLVTASSLPWYAAQIMADIYTPLVVLIAFLLMYTKAMKRSERIVLWTLFFLFITTHNSHFPLVAGLLVAELLIWLVRGRRNNGRPTALLGMLVCMLAAAALIAGFNLAQNGQFRLSRASNVFLAGRLCEEGLLQEFLTEHCATRHYSLCERADLLPRNFTEFVWTKQGFMQHDSLTFAQADSVLTPLISDLFSDPKYASRYVGAVLVGTAKQFVQWQAGAGLHAYGPGTAPHSHHWWRYPHEKVQYETALQQQGRWEQVSWPNRIIGVALLLSLASLLFVARRGVDARSPIWTLARLVLLALLLNAVVTSMLSTVDPRLQSRLLWLVPVVAILGWHANTGGQKTDSTSALARPR